MRMKVYDSIHMYSVGTLCFDLRRNLLIYVTTESDLHPTKATLFHNVTKTANFALHPYTLSCTFSNGNLATLYVILTDYKCAYKD